MSPVYLGEPPVAPTLGTLISLVSDHLGDLETGTLTSVTNGSTMADNTRFEPDTHFNGGLLSFTNGPAIGLESRITSWTKSGGVLVTNTFNPAPVTGNAYELRKEPNHQRGAIKRFLNEGVRNIQRADWVLLDSRSDLSDTTVYSQYANEYAMPSQLTYVHRVMWQDPNATVVPAPAHPDLTWYPILPSHWFTNDFGSGSIVIEKLANIPDTAPLKFLGSRRPAEMVNETDVCEADPNFITLYAAMSMSLRLARGATDGDQWLRKAAFFEQEAGRARVLARRALPPDARKVR